MSAALQSKKYELKTICDANEELCRQRGKEFDFHNYTTSYQQMLEDKDIDVIAIYTPDHSISHYFLYFGQIPSNKIYRMTESSVQPFK